MTARVLPHPTTAGAHVTLEEEDTPLILLAWADDYRHIQLRSVARTKVHRLLHGLDKRRLDLLAAELEDVARTLREAA